MSPTPVQLDFSKAQPATQPASSSAVSLDFSKAQPVATGDALKTAAATVPDPTKGVINDDSYNLAGTAYSAVAPVEPPKAHPDFKMHLDSNDGKWELKATYPAGQKPLDPKYPEMSTDDEGNMYHQGNKVETLGAPLVPVGPLAAAAKAVPALTRAAIASSFGQTAIKFGGKYLMKAAATAGAGAALEFGREWYKKLKE